MSSLLIQPLLAVDLTHVAITLVVLFLAVMKQLFDSSKEANKKKNVANAGPRPPQLQPQPAPPRPAQGGGQADALRSQVEEFLRRASQPPQAEAARLQEQPQRRPTSEIELLVADNARNRTSPAAAAAQAAVAADKKRAARRPSKRQTVAEHVEQQVAARSQNIAQKASNLGQRIVNEDEQFDIQLKAKFDHTVGSLAASAATSPEQQLSTPTTPAAQIAAMLANPDGVRQAVVLNEILRRPSDRW